MRTANNGRKTFLVLLLSLLSLLIFTLVGCGGDKNAEEEKGGQTATPITIEGAVDFTFNAELIEKITFGSKTDVAESVSEISRGEVPASAVVDNAIVLGSAIYRIKLKDIPSAVDLSEYALEIERSYLALFVGWQNFPDAPVIYKTVNGKDVLVYVSTEYSENGEIRVYVYFFNEGSVGALAELYAGGSHGGGGGDSHGGEGEGEHGEEERYIPVTFLYPDGSREQLEFLAGDTAYFATINYDKEYSLSADFNPILTEYDGVIITEGLTVYVRVKQVVPTEVRVSITDIDKDGNKVPYTSEAVNYGAKFKFVYYGFVLFYDEACTKEIDVNETYEITEDIEVYRRDELDRVPVFVTIHYVINGIEDRTENRTFFRGEILRSKKKIIYDTSYEIFRGNGDEKMFESGKAVVIKETDDMLHIYCRKDDPMYHKVTFKVGESELITVLMYDGDIIGRWSIAGAVGGYFYEINACSDMDERITKDTIVTISEYTRTATFGVTECICYNGQVKYSFTNRFTVGDEWEIDESYGAYTDASCSTLFTGKITSATTIYKQAPVDFGRLVDSSGSDR